MTSRRDKRIMKNSFTIPPYHIFIIVIIFFNTNALYVNMIRCVGAVKPTRRRRRGRRVMSGRMTGGDTQHDTQHAK